MKHIVYTLLLTLLLGLTAADLFATSSMDAMSMPRLYSLCTALVLYTIGISLVGETHNADERDVMHRNVSNRVALICGTIFLSSGLIYSLFVLHSINRWLLAGLVVINLTKVATLLYLHYRK